MPVTRVSAAADRACWSCIPEVTLALETERFARGEMAVDSSEEGCGRAFSVRLRKSGAAERLAGPRGPLGERAECGRIWSRAWHRVATTCALTGSRCGRPASALHSIPALLADR